MLTHREIIEHAALCAARCRSLTLLAGVISASIGTAAIAWLVYPHALELVRCVAVAEGCAAVIVTAKLHRINRRLQALRKFL